MRPLSLLGAGFIGGRYAQLYPEDTVIEPRECVAPSQLDVLMTRSTVDNYNVVKPGKLKLDVETNLMHLLDVLPNVRGCFAFTSSWFCYGRGPGSDAAHPARETDPCDPNGLYSITKLAAEKVIRSYVETVAACTTGSVVGPSAYRIMRLGNVIGNDPRAGRQKAALEWLLKLVLAGEDVPVYEGDCYRDVLHLDDTCRAIRLCLEQGQPNAIYNIGRGESHRMVDLIVYAIKATGSRSQIKRVPVPAFHRIVQVPDIWLDTTKLRALGYVPQLTVWQSIDRVLAGLTQTAVPC